MKKLLTILMLLILAGQLSGYVDLKQPDTSLVQECDSKGKKDMEEKSGKEYISPATPRHPDLAQETVFCSFACMPAPFPAVEDHTPPPDVKCMI